MGLFDRDERERSSRRFREMVPVSPPRRVEPRLSDRAVALQHRVDTWWCENVVFDQESALDDGMPGSDRAAAQQRLDGVGERPGEHHTAQRPGDEVSSLARGQGPDVPVTVFTGAR